MATPFQKYVYHGSLLNYLHLFNTIMSRVQVKTERGLMQIPITMTAGRRNDLNRNVPANSLPVATMSMTDLSINKQITGNYQNNLMTSNSIGRQRIPIILNLTYNVRTKKMYEMLQVVEQILLVFTPSLNCSIKDNDTLMQDQVIKIQLEGQSITDNWEGEGTESNHTDGEFSFSLHGFVYGEDIWVKDPNGGGQNAPVIEEIVIERGVDMRTPWTELDPWFTVDKDGVHHPDEE